MSYLMSSLFLFVRLFMIDDPCYRWITCYMVITQQGKTRVKLWVETRVTVLVVDMSTVMFYNERKTENRRHRKRSSIPIALGFRLDHLLCPKRVISASWRQTSMKRDHRTFCPLFQRPILRARRPPSRPRHARPSVPQPRLRACSHSASPADGLRRP